MNKSIYKKQLAFKNSLPQYGNGGKKFAAGLAGFAKNIPMLGQVIDPLVANTDAVKENQVAYASGNLVGSTAKTIGMGIVNPLSLASNVPQTIGAGLNVGSAVATEEGNLDTAQGLNTASTALTGLGSVAGMATGVAGGMGNIPIKMKDGGSLIRYNLPEHSEGGGAIDANGKLVNPNSNLAQAELEKKETLDTNQNYVFSDTLKPMKSIKTFADLSRKIDSKYKDRNDDIAKATKAKELENLAMQNEEMRLAKEAKSNPLKMKNGGKLPKYNDGAPFVEGYKRDGLDYLNNDYTLRNVENTIPINMIAPTASEMTPQFKPSTVPTIGTNYKVNNDSINTTTNSNQQFTTGDKFQLAGLAPATIYNTIQALRPAEKFKPLTSSYMDAGLADMNQNVRFNTNPILMNRNVGANQINQGSTSDAVRRANLQSLYRGTNTQLGEMAEKEALTNIGIKQQLGQAKIGVGAQDVAAQERARQYNVQARQAKQQFAATAASQFGQGLTEFGKSSNQGLSNRIGYDVLKNIAPNFTLTEYNNLVKKGMSDSEIIKYLKA